MKELRILITGANGFLGSGVSRILEENHEIQKLSNHVAEGFINLDLTNYNAVAIAIDQKLLKPADVMVHLASVTASPDSVDDISILTMNAMMAKSVAMIAKAIGCHKLVNASSMAVYPNMDGLFSESSLVDPSPNNDCVYGLSKFNTEILLNYFLRNSNLTISHLRLAMVNGVGMKENRIPPVMQRELNEKGTITVFGNGERLLNIISIEKAALTIKKFVESDLPGIYNVGEEIISMEELALRIKGNSDGKIIRQPSGNKSKFRLDISKLRSISESD